MVVETTRNSAEPQPKQPGVERPADSPNAEPHPVEDLREAPKPTVEQLLAKEPAGKTPAGNTPGVSGISTPGVKEAGVTEVSPPAEGPIEELLKVDETKSFSFDDAAQLAQKLEQLRKVQNLEIRN